MAIAGALPGVSVAVVANGRVLREHEDFDIQDDDRSVTRYIEAASNWVFEVHFSVSRTTELLGDTISFRVYVDGHLADDRIVCKEQIADRIFRYEMKSVGVEMPGAMFRNYRFSGLQALEARRMQDAPEVKDLGTIKVTVDHKNRIERTTCEASLADRLRSTEGVGEVSEKDLKGQAISHSVSFLAAKQGPQRTWWKTSFVDPSERPAAVFEYRYRSHGALKAMRVIPQTPSPEPQPESEPLENRDISTLTRDELLELQRRAREAVHLREQSANIEQEQGSNSPDTMRHSREQSVDVKQEQRHNSPGRRKTRRNGELIIIELDDDGEVIRERTTKVDAHVDAVVDLEN